MPRSLRLSMGLDPLPGHSEYLDPPNGVECDDPNCRDGWIYGVDGDGRETDPERCPSEVHMTENERRAYMRWMRDGQP